MHVRMDLLQQHTIVEHECCSPCVMPLNESRHALPESVGIQRTTVMYGDWLIVDQRVSGDCGMEPYLFLTMGCAGRGRAGSYWNHRTRATLISNPALQPGFDESTLLRRQGRSGSGGINRDIHSQSARGRQNSAKLNWQLH